MKEKKQKILINGLTIIFIGFLIWCIFHQNYKDVLAIILQVPLGLFFFILAVGMMYQCIEAGICFLLVKRYLKDFSYTSALQLVFIGFFTNIASMGTGIIPAKSYYLYKHGMSVGRGVSIMTYEYIFHKTSVLLWVIFLFPVISNVLQEGQSGICWWLIFGIMATATINLLMILLCTWEKFRTFSFYILEKISFKGKWKQKKETWKEQINGLFGESKSVIQDKKLVIKMLILNLVKLAVLYILPWISFLAIGEEQVCMFGKSFILASVMVLMTNVIPHVAGIGPAEYMFIFIYGFYVSEASAASAMLLYRASTYFLPFFVSIAVVLSVKRREQKEQMKERRNAGYRNIEAETTSLTIKEIVRK